MSRISIDVYEDDGVAVKKTVTGETVEVMFGTVRNLMKVLKIADGSKENTAALLAAIVNSWDDVTQILDAVFPEMDESDWNHVKISDVLGVIVQITKYSMQEIIGAVTTKNQTRE